MAAHVDDASTSSGPQTGQQYLADLEHAGEIELEQPLPAIHRHRRQGSGPGGASIVDDHPGLQTPPTESIKAWADRLRIGQVDTFALHPSTADPEDGGQLIELAAGPGREKEIET
jgi:hypothetical protein